MPARCQKSGGPRPNGRGDGRDGAGVRRGRVKERSCWARGLGEWKRGREVALGKGWLSPVVAGNDVR